MKAAGSQQLVTCSSCGRTIGHSAPGQLCPACLLDTMRTPGAGEESGQGQLQRTWTVNFPQLEIIRVLGRFSDSTVLDGHYLESRAPVRLQFWNGEEVERAGGEGALSHWVGTLSRLDHPALAEIHDFGMLGDGFFLIAGRREGRRVAECLRETEHDETFVESVLRQSTDALAVARQSGAPLMLSHHGVMADGGGRVSITAPFSFEGNPGAGRMDRAGPGSRIGNYLVEARLGEGAFGEVFRARQTEPVRREVALKIIKPGMDSRRVVARFEAERQALALLDHPNIARIHDAGADAQGRPFFVMEFVEGVPITEYCSLHQLGIRQRIDLFIDVCRAVEHAHQKGIIHRDLKPSNVLVSGTAAELEGGPDTHAVAKVIDFGVAKALGEPLSDHGFVTRDEQMVGTPVYMSPEQASGEGAAADSRSDVYGLGVLLYELLTGRTPVEIAGSSGEPIGIDELRRRIREEEPLKPSASAVPGQQAEGGRWRQALRGDLDWIVLRALAKAPGERYQSVSGLIDDLDRHLHDEPVSAGPPSARYRVAKFVRRHRLAVAAAAVALTALVGGLVLASFGLVRAKAEEAKATAASIESDREARLSAAVTEFLQDDLLAQADPFENGDGNDVRLRDVLDRAALLLPERFPDDPDVRGGLHQTLADSYLAVGRYDEALRQATEALSLLEVIAGRHDPRALAALQSLAAVHSRQSQFEKAGALFKEVHEQRKAILGPRHPDTLEARSEVATNLSHQGRHGEAEQDLREVLRLQGEVLGASSKEALETMMVLGEALFRQSDADKRDEALVLLRECVARGVDAFGPQSPTVLRAKQFLGVCLNRQGQVVEAEEVTRETLRGLEQLVGREHPTALTTMSNLGSILTNRQKHDEAIRLLQEVLDLRRKSGAGDDRGGYEILQNLGLAFRESGRHEDALAQFEEALAACERVHGADHHHTLVIRHTLMTQYEKLGRLLEAAEMSRQLVSTSRVVSGPTHQHTLGRINELATLLKKLGDYEECESLLREEWARFSREFGEDDARTFNLLDHLGDAILGRAMQAVNSSRGEDHAEAIFAEAVPIYERRWKIRERRFGADEPATLDAKMDWITQRINAGEDVPEHEREWAEERFRSTSPAR